MAMVSVTAQCVGARDYEQVKYYYKKLMKIAYATMFLINLIVVALLPVLIKLYNLGTEAAEITRWIIIFSCDLCLPYLAIVFLYTKYAARSQ